MPARHVLELLGTPRLRDADGRECALPSRRAFALLTVLAVEGEVARSRLATLFWGELDDASARRNLRRELARLRSDGLEATFVAIGDRLRLGDGVASDLDAFRSAAARGDGSDALAAWRGPLLDGFELAEAAAFREWLGEQRGRLVQRWRELAAQQAARSEAAGDTRAALGWHASLVDDDPLQELHHVNVMRLHHLLGERRPALAAWERCRQVLRDELGIAPSAATVALAEQIRSPERLSSLALRRADAALRRVEAPFVGRAAEVARLRERAEVAVLLLEGEAGVGKTRLAQEVLRAGSTVAIRCEAIAREAPLHAVTEALRALLETPERLARLAPLGADDRREAARLLPALAREPGSRRESLRPAVTNDMPPATASASMAARQRFLDALGEALDLLAGPGGCVWIDDAQWADESTLALIAHLANRRVRDPARHVALLLAARPLENVEGSVARDAIRRLERSGLLLRVPLAPFGAEDTLQLVRELSGSGRGERFAARLQESTRGNPYFLLETLRYLFDAGELRIDAEGRWETAYDDAATYGRLPVPPTVRDAVIERVERLGAPSRRVLEIAALAGDGFTLDLLRPASALDDWQAVEGLELSLQAGFVSGSVQGYRFSHELVRDALAGQLSEERRRLIHHRLADTLIDRRGAPVRIATHLESAGLGASAVPWRIAAAAAARGLYAWREALDQLAAAAPHATALADRRDIARQRIELARLLYDVVAMEAAIDALAEVAAGAGDEAAAIEALVWRAEWAQMRKRPLEAALPAESAIARAGFATAAPELRLRSHLALAHARFASGRLDAADFALADATALAEAEGDALTPPLRALLLRGLANAARLRQDPARAEPLLREAAQLLDGDAHLETRLQTLNLLAHVQHMGGRGEDAIATLEGCLADAERAGLTVVLRSVLPNLVTLCADAGQAERGRAFLERGVAALRFVDDDATRGAMQSRLGELSLTAGDIGAAWRAAGESIGHYEANGGGAPDYAPWCMRWSILLAAGADRAAEAIYRDLPQSPAWTETPASRAIRALKIEVTRIAGDPAGAVERLLALREPPDAAYAASEADHWRATALLAAGRAGEAHAVAATVQPRDLGLLLHPASLAALRLRIAVARGEVLPEAFDAAEAMLAEAHPLPALELRAAIADAHLSVGDVAAADAARHACAQRAEALAATLAAVDPHLASGLAGRWATPAFAGR